jgi:hypothetical protein
MRADKYAVSKNRVTRIASNAASRAFNAASTSRRDDNSDEEELRDTL